MSLTHAAIVLILSTVVATPLAADKTALDQATVPLPDGGRIAYHIRPGTGPTLVFIPGSWGDHHVFDATLQHLDATLNVVVVEMRGHGGSWPPTLSGSIEQFADDVLRVTDSLNLQRYFVGGHSIGGMIAVELAGRRPAAVSGALSIEGWTHFEVQREAFGHITGTTLNPEQEAVRLAARARVLNQLTEEQRTAFASVWRRWNGLPILNTTNVPVLEIWGDRGHASPSRTVMRIPDRPGIQLEWINGASHSLLIERPQEVGRHINQFIEDLSERPPLPSDPALMCDVPELNVESGDVDFSRLPRVELDTITVFQGVENSAGFNMHPYVAHFDGRFWAMWSCNYIRDLQAGQHVRYATSVDGKQWSDPRMLMPPEDQQEMRYFARGFWKRDGKLIALAARDKAVRPLFAANLELRGYVWNKDSDNWGRPVVVADDTINNFPPRRLPSGRWMMSRRDHRMQKSMMIGGVLSLDDWTSYSIHVPEDGANLDEPFW